MVVTRRLASFLLLTGGFQWLVWPNFLRVVLRDERSFDDGPTAFLAVHLAIILPGLALATGLLAVGARAWRQAARQAPQGPAQPGPRRLDTADR